MEFASGERIIRAATYARVGVSQNGTWNRSVALQVAPLSLAAYRVGLVRLSSFRLSVVSCRLSVSLNSELELSYREPTTENRELRTEN
jgi:hypothetical protein